MTRPHSPPRIRRAALMAVLLGLAAHATAAPGGGPLTARSPAGPGRAQAAKPVQARPPLPSWQGKRCVTPKGRTPDDGGRFQGLIRRIAVPGDCAYYSPFHVYGWWAYGSYGSLTGLPHAYWVYHYPDWYLYRRERSVTPPPPPSGPPPTVTPPPVAPPPAAPPSPPPATPTCQPPKKIDPSVNGRYSGLQRRLRLPSDCAVYGAFRDYGAYPATTYGGVANLPPAHWVYHYPDWYLWRTRHP